MAWNAAAKVTRTAKRSRIVSAMVVCAACLTESPDGSRFCPARARARRPGASEPRRRGAVGGPARGAQGRQRPCPATSSALPRCREAADPEDVDRAARGVRADGTLGDRGPRRRRREVHRRRGRRRVRRARRRTRTTPLRAVRAGAAPSVDGAASDSRRSVARPLACGSGSTPARHSCGSTSRPSSGERLIDRRRDQHRVTDPVGRARAGRAVGEAT